MFFWHLVLKILSHNSYWCNLQKCYIETIQFLGHLNDLLIVLLFYHYSSLIIKPVFLKFFFLCLKSKIVQLKTQFDMYFDRYRQMIWSHFQTLKCYIFISFIVLNNLIKRNYLLKVCLWKPIKCSFSGVLNCSNNGFIILTFVIVLLFYHFSFLWIRPILLR